MPISEAKEAERPETVIEKRRAAKNNLKFAVSKYHIRTGNSAHVLNTCKRANLGLVKVHVYQGLWSLGPNILQP